MITENPLLVRLSHLREHLDEGECTCDESIGWICNRCYFSHAVIDAIHELQDHDREDDAREEMRKNPPYLGGAKRKKH